MMEGFLNPQHRERCIKDFQGQRPLRKMIVVKNPSRAAVLVPICTILHPLIPDDELSRFGLLYTKRTAHLSSHAREVSFPGGKCDSDDETEAQAALRETEEELGISPNHVNIWTNMPMISNKTGTGIVTPVIGQLSSQLDLTSLNYNRNEVEEVFVKSFRELMDPVATGYTQFRVKGTSGYSLPVYKTAPHAIWGMTAIITFQFLQVLLKNRGYAHKLLFQTPLTKLR